MPATSGSQPFVSWADAASLRVRAGKHGELELFA